MNVLCLLFYLNMKYACVKHKLSCIGMHVSLCWVFKGITDHILHITLHTNQFSSLLSFPFLSSPLQSPLFHSCETVLSSKLIHKFTVYNCVQPVEQCLNMPVAFCSFAQKYGSSPVSETYRRINEWLKNCQQHSTTSFKSSHASYGSNHSRTDIKPFSGNFHGLMPASTVVSINAQMDVFTSIKYVQNAQNCWFNRHQQ